MDLLEKRKERILKVRLEYSHLVKDLECPFVWHFYKLFDTLEFSRFFHDTASIGDLSLDLDETQALADYSDQIVRIYCHFIMNGAQFALEELSLFMMKLDGSRSDGSSIKNALTFIGKSCRIFLYLCVKGRNKLVWKEQAMDLKSQLQLLKSRQNRGHLGGIQGLVAVRMNENVHAVPFLRNAVFATEHCEYTFILAKSISRIRISRSSNDVSDEELELFAKVARDHPFAIPYLLDSIFAKARYLVDSRRFDELIIIQRQQGDLLRAAWDNRELFGAKGLTRLANTFGSRCKFKDPKKAEKLYAMAYNILPNCPYNLHRYGLFLAKNKPGKTIEDVKKGLDFLARAKYLAAFLSMCQIYEENVRPRGIKPFEDYLVSFIKNAETVEDKRFFTFVAYKYYLGKRQVTPALDYLKSGINEDPAEMKIGAHLVPYQKQIMSSLSVEGINMVFPQSLDLSYEVGYITDVLHTALFGKENVIEFERWWQNHPALKPMGSYAGFKDYHTEQGEKGARSLGEGPGTKYSESFRDSLLIVYF